jgi:hypothetical protein
MSFTQKLCQYCILFYFTLKMEATSPSVTMLSTKLHGVISSYSSIHGKLHYRHKSSVNLSTDRRTRRVVSRMTRCKHKDTNYTCVLVVVFVPLISADALCLLCSAVARQVFPLSPWSHRAPWVCNSICVCFDLQLLKLCTWICKCKAP